MARRKSNRCMTFKEILKLRKHANVLHSGTASKKKLASAARAIKRLVKNKRACVL